MRLQIDMLQRELLGVENELADVSQVINRESEHPELIVRAMEPQVKHMNAVVAMVAVLLLLLLLLMCQLLPPSSLTCPPVPSARQPAA